MKSATALPRRFAQLSLQSKLTFMLVAGAIAIGVVATSIAFLYITYLLADSSTEGAFDAAIFAPDHSALITLLALLGGVVVTGMFFLAELVARLISAPFGEIAAAAEKIAASGRPGAHLTVHSDDDELGRMASAFNAMVDRLAESYIDLEQRVAERTREYEESQQEAEKASNLLREAVASIAQGFTIYDENDRLVICNDAYKSFYETSRDLILPGNTFEEIVRRGAERGQYEQAKGNIDKWVRGRVLQHQSANGEVIEQQLGDGRWLMIVEYRTPSGYIVGNRIDITELKRTAEALRQRELYLRATLDNLPFLFWLKDAESRFLAVNKIFSDACGRASPEELVGLTDFDVWPAELADRYRTDDFEVMTCRCARSVEEPVAGGAAAGWIETYKKPVIAADGTTLGTVGFARDISERKQMEQALAESEQRWELAVTGANDGVWDWNPQTGKVYFSERWKTMLGYRPEEIGDSVDEWINRIHPDDRAHAFSTLENHLSGKTEFYQCEHRLLCKDGSYKWILDRGRALLDADGKAVRMSGSHTDFSERHEAEACIRDRNEQLDTIFALSPDGFVSFDARHHVKYANPAFFNMTGLVEADIIGLDETGFSACLARECIEQARFRGVAALRPARKVGAGETAQEASGGRRELIILAGAGKRVLEVGIREAQAETVSLILYFRDITHETEVDRLKSEFLSTAAHELRTPMASIYGFTELLLTQEFDIAVQRDFLGTIFKQSELMVSIINELLDLARIDARRGKDFNLARVDVQALLHEVTAGFKTPGNRAAPQVSALATPRWVHADRKKLIQAITNILSNAYKYSPAGGTVKLDTVIAPAGPGMPERIGIRVIDHGIGMTPEQLARVCERFYRVDTSGKIPGTGLGMSIVKEIVELHGGEVILESKVGAGTTACLWLPAETTPDAETRHTEIT